MITAGLRRVLALSAGAALLSGCSSLGPDEAAAGEAAQEFFAAVRSGDGGEACNLLSEDVQTDLEQTADQPCSTAILEQDLPSAERVTEVLAFGRNAQVVMDSDVLFLSVADGGWKILAAGCRPRASAPYDCTLSGG